MPTTANTIDHVTLLHLVEAGAMRGADVIGTPTAGAMWCVTELRPACAVQRVVIFDAEIGAESGPGVRSRPP